MENEEVKHLGALGTASACAGAAIGTVAKVTTGVKNLLARPVDDIEPDVDEDEQAEAATQSPALEPETENTGSEEPELACKVTSLEAELVETHNLLTEAKSRADKWQSEFATQIDTLQTEKDFLIFDLEQATKEVNDSKSIEVTLRARVIALESELDATKGKSKKTRSPLIYAKPLLSEVDAAEVEQDTDISEKITAPQDDVKVEAVIEEPQPEPEAVESEIPALEEVEDIEAEQAETQAREFVPVIAETLSSVPADVTVEEADAADFDSATEKIIFNNALSGIASSDEAERLDAVKVMAGIHHELSARALIGQMEKEPAAQIRAECIRALAELNMKEGLPAIENALSEQVVLVRLAAVRGLYRLGGSASAPELIRMLCDENEDIRRRTATCIGWLGKEELAVELVPLLDDSNVSVRLAAVEAMGNLRSRKVVSALIEHLSDSEKTVRKTIVSALKTITGKKMSGSFPRDEKSFQILIIRWREWWRDEQKVLCRI